MAKTTFTTTIFNLTRDAQEFAKAVIKAAEKKNGGYFTVTVEEVKRPGTDEQNKAFHALLQEYWASGCSSYQSFEDMRDKIKLRTGGAEGYIYWKGVFQVSVKSLNEIPSGALYVCLPKSWRDFTKEERVTAVDFLIAEMYQAGVNTKKFDEILRGMERGE